MRPLDTIIVHCSATRPDWMMGRATADKVAEIRRWHVTPPRNWRDIGYHILIDRNGTVANGRPLEQVGTHTKGHNTGSVGICLIGGHGSDANDKFAEHFTEHQDRALQRVIADLIRRYPTITRVAGHNQFAQKACPGFNVPSWYAAARAHVNKTAKS